MRVTGTAHLLHSRQIVCSAAETSSRTATNHGVTAFLCRAAFVNGVKHPDQIVQTALLLSSLPSPHTTTTLR